MTDAQLTTVREYEQRKLDLYFALRTRVLTDEEWAQVVEHGDHLNISSLQPYFATEKMKELNDAYLQQFKLRLAAKEK